MARKWRAARMPTLFLIETFTTRKGVILWPSRIFTYPIDLRPADPTVSSAGFVAVTERVSIYGETKEAISLRGNSKMTKRKVDDREFDFHVWIKPEDDSIAALFTVSIGKRAVCIDMPIDDALDAMREEMESHDRF
jgi:hypothetical protein